MNDDALPAAPAALTRRPFAGRAGMPQKRRVLTRSGLSSAIFLELLLVTGIMAWVLYALAIVATRPALDWMTFYTAVRLYFDGHMGLLFDGPRLTALQNALFSTALVHPIRFQPWVYPPSFLLLILPFGLLPFWPAYAAFLVASLCGMVAAIRAYVVRRSDRWLLCLSLALCPAMPAEIFGGQNGLLTCALLLGSFAALRGYPVLAGVLLGLLSFKPQLGLMIPVALIAGRHFKTVASAAVATGVVAAISLAVFGPEPWTQWLAFATGRGDLYHQWVIENRVHGMSVFASVAALGTSLRIATIIQAGAIAISAGCVYWTFRTRVDNSIKLAVLMCATILSAPHLLPYDMLPLGVAATVLYLSCEVKKRTIASRGVCLALWSTPALPLFGASTLSSVVVACCFGYLLSIVWRSGGSFRIPGPLMRGLTTLRDEPATRG